jgi:hypothetical protein
MPKKEKNNQQSAVSKFGVTPNKQASGKHHVKNGYKSILSALPTA